MIGCGLSEGAIAEALKIPIGTVRSRRGAIGKRLRTKLLKGAIASNGEEVLH
jgi:DNA-binding NarL/FixJ family response regulator